MTENAIDRLTQALYRVTERMADEEPLKWKLREQALRFHELVNLSEASISFKKAEERLGLIRNITSLLDLTSSLSYVAKVNFDALRREYLLLEKSAPPVLLAEQPLPEEQSFVSLSSQENQNERQKKIIEYLQKTQNSSIGDISKLFSDAVSEKTLQRDLNGLMLQGLVRAEGDRRWRKYSLLKNTVSA